MGRRFIILGFLLAVSLASSVFSAGDLPDWKDKHVNDFAGILSSVQADGMRGLLAGIERDTTAEIVFASDGECTSRGGPGQYAFELFSKWEIGKKDKDNGLLVLYCKEENKIWVTTGYGLEGILPDSKVGRMLDEYYVPLRESGNISEGIVLFVEQVSQVILDNKEEVLSGQAGARDVSIYSYLPVIIWLVIFILIIISRAKRLKKSERRSSSLWWIPILLPRGSGFGGGGFGGGMSGGGGAGR